MDKKLEHKYAYYSARYLEWFMDTKSLNKIEKRISDENNNNKWREAFVASGYVYFNKMNTLDKDKHPNLFKHVQNFSKAKPILESKNDYDKVWVQIENKVKMKDIKNETKDSLRLYVLEYLEKRDKSLNELCKGTNVKYSNLYKFIFNNENNQISIEKIRGVTNKINEYWKNEN